MTMSNVLAGVCLAIGIYGAYCECGKENVYAHTTGLRIEAPSAPAERISGCVTDTATDGNARFIHGGNHTIRLVEEKNGALFSYTEPVSYEIRIVQPGVHISDAQIRGRIDGRDMTHMDTRTLIGARSFESGWQSPENSSNFLAEQTEFYGASFKFTLRPFLSDREERLRSLEIGLMLSVVAGFEHNHGGMVEAEIFREGVYIGTAHIANITDPITIVPGEAVRLYRMPPDVMPLTPVGTFTIIEAAPGKLQYNYKLQFRLEITQLGRHVTVPFMPTLFLSNLIINEDESGLRLENVRVPGIVNRDNITLRVVNPSYGVPAEITFGGIYLAGAIIPFLRYHIVIYGPEITSNSDEFPVVAIHDFGYSALVLQAGDYYYSGIEEDTYLPEPPHPFAPRHYFNSNTMVFVDGVYIQAAAFPTVAPHVVSSMMNPRVFANHIGAVVIWDEAARTVRFTGNSTAGIPQTVILTLDSPIITVNGIPYDIAQKSLQPALSGQITPVVIGGRVFVPVRVLAEIFGIRLRTCGQ